MTGSWRFGFTSVVIATVTAAAETHVRTIYEAQDVDSKLRLSEELVTEGVLRTYAEPSYWDMFRKGVATGLPWQQSALFGGKEMKVAVRSWW